MPAASKARIAITGVGVCSPIGVGSEAFWRAALEGRNGLNEIQCFDHAELRTHLGGEVRDFAPAEHLASEQLETLGRAAQLALVASQMAVRSAGLEGDAIERYESARRAVSFGTTMGEPGMLDQLVGEVVRGGVGAVTAERLFALPSFRMCDHIARRFRCAGPVFQLPTACTAGNYAIGYGADLLRAGRADLLLVGGSDAFSRMAHVGFNKLLAVTPDRVRPFDLNRSGMAVGEGAGALVLERLDDALARGASVLAELLDWGMGCDAHKMTIPHPEGLGGALALRRAMERSGIEPAQVDYISAHGTGTRENDKIETAIIKAVLGPRAYELKISSVKSMLGHTMGAASALEAIVCTLALRDGIVPPTINYETPDPLCDLDYVPNVAQRVEPRVAISNAYAFGGNCSSLVLQRYEGARA
jgi:3-oxoacyl-[acyl-carrier-protein] synthase II